MARSALIVGGLLLIYFAYAGVLVVAFGHDEITEIRAAWGCIGDPVRFSNGVHPANLG